MQALAISQDAEAAQSLVQTYGLLDTLTDRQPDSIYMLAILSLDLDACCVKTGLEPIC